MNRAEATKVCRAVCLAAAALALPACGSKSGAGVGGSDAVPVSVAAAVQRDVPIEVRAIGKVTAFATVEVKPQVSGQIAAVHFTEGQEVRKGDLLFTIDPRPFEAALRQAEANLARNRAEAANAEAERRRVQHLFEDKIVSQDEYDKARTRAASFAAASRADGAAVEDARLRLEYCAIRAPIGGRVGAVLAQIGNVPKINETPLAVIHQIRPVYVSFTVPEKELPEVRRRSASDKLEVRASPTGVAAEPVTGELAFIDNAVDATTGTVLLKAVFENRDESLWSGQFVDVALRLGVQKAAVLVPKQAILAGQQGRFGYVLRADDTVEARPLVVGRAVEQEIVVERGLAPGDRIVTDGQIRLAPGLKVAVKNSVTTAER